MHALIHAYIYTYIPKYVYIHFFKKNFPDELQKICIRCIGCEGRNVLYFEYKNKYQLGKKRLRRTI